MDQPAEFRERMYDLVDAEVAAAKAHDEQTAQLVQETRADQKTVLHELARVGDIEDLLEVERIFLALELETLASSPAMETSLNNAIEELNAALRTLERVRDPDAYRSVAESYSLPKNRKRGLPQDEARQFFKSHLTRLGNLDRGRLSDSERGVLSARADNLKEAQRLYIKLQEHAMGTTTLA